MTVPAATTDLLVPEGTRLVHIGPFKTGTTSLQAAFHVGRAQMHAQGVHYTGPNAQPIRPVMAATGRAHVMDGQPPPIKAWRRLVREIEEAREPRVVVSSEFFADAAPDAIRRIVRDLDPARVHIVVTLRPLARIVPSQWQQFVQGGTGSDFDSWLRTTFEAQADGSGSMFWARHRHDQLIARWADVVGPGNLTVVVVDDQDHAMVLRVFERLLGLARGTLETPRERSNRSLSRPEVDAILAFNNLAREEGIGRPLMAQVMRYGASNYMKLRDPSPDEAKVELPSWAAQAVADVAREIVAGVRGLGVRVIGDLDSLVPGAAGSSRIGGSSRITPEVAAAMTVGVLLASGVASGRGNRSRSTDMAMPACDEVAAGPIAHALSDPRALALESTTRIRSIFVRRVRTAVRASWESVRRPLPRG